MFLEKGTVIFTVFIYSNILFDVLTRFLASPIEAMIASSFLSIPSFLLFSALSSIFLASFSFPHRLPTFAAASPIAPVYAEAIETAASSEFAPSFSFTVAFSAAIDSESMYSFANFPASWSFAGSLDFSYAASFVSNAIKELYRLVFALDAFAARVVIFEAKFAADDICPAYGIGIIAIAEEATEAV